MMATRIQSVTCHFASLPDDCLQPSSLAERIQDAAGILRTPRRAEASPSRARQSSFMSLQLELERRFIFSQPHNEDGLSTTTIETGFNLWYALGSTFAKHGRALVKACGGLDRIAVS